MALRQATVPLATVSLVTLFNNVYTPGGDHQPFLSETFQEQRMPLLGNYLENDNVNKSEQGHIIINTCTCVRPHTIIGKILIVKEIILSPNTKIQTRVRIKRTISPS